MTVHEQAVDAAMEIECKKDSLRQNQDGTWKLVLTVAPDGLPDAIMKAPPGVRYRAFFVEVDDNEQPVKHEKPKTRFNDKPLSVQAGIRCSDQRFHAFLRHRGAACNSDPVEQAAAYVRWLCDVKSRSDIGDNMAGVKWEALDSEYLSWAGHTAEMR